MIRRVKDELAEMGEAMGQAWPLRCQVVRDHGTNGPLRRSLGVVNAQRSYPRGMDRIEVARARALWVLHHAEKELTVAEVTERANAMTPDEEKDAIALAAERIPDDG